MNTPPDEDHDGLSYLDGYNVWGGSGANSSLVLGGDDDTNSFISQYQQEDAYTEEDEDGGGGGGEDEDVEGGGGEDEDVEGGAGGGGDDRLLTDLHEFERAGGDLSDRDAVIRFLNTLDYLSNQEAVINEAVRLMRLHRFLSSPATMSASVLRRLESDIDRLVSSLPESCRDMVHVTDRTATISEALEKGLLKEEDDIFKHLIKLQAKAIRSLR